MSEVPGSGETVTAPPPAPDFPTYERESNARDLGQPIAPATPAAPPPATPGDTGAATAAATAAASEPATPDDTTRPNLQTRTKQLDTEVANLQQKLALRRALRDELATLDRPAHVPPASEPAQPTKAEWERYFNHSDAPKEEDFELYPQFVAAMGLFVADKRFEERDARAHEDAQSRERMGAVQQTITGFHERLSKAREADPTFDSKVDPGLLQIVPAFALRPGEPLRPANVLVQACVESEAATDLLTHFSTPEGQREWGDLAAAPTPAAMLRKFGRIEARFVSDGTPAGVSPAKPVTSAPAPPTTLGHKPPSSPDRVGAALKAGDYLTYEAAQDAADLAVRRR